MLLGVTVFAGYQQQRKINHVIYITLDGTRWQNVMLPESSFPRMWKKYASKMNVYGKPGSDSVMEVASIPVSLPSYQSQMTGAVQPCESNECGQVKVETLPEYLMSKLHLNKKDVAVFSSWPEIAHALESRRGTVYSNVGNLPVVDPVSERQMQKWLRLIICKPCVTMWKPIAWMNILLHNRCIILKNTNRYLCGFPW